MSNFNTGQSRQWQPGGNQAPAGQNNHPSQQGAGGGYDRQQASSGGAYQKRDFTPQERRTGRSIMKGGLRQPGICRVDGHPIPAGSRGVQLDYDNRDANDKAQLQCPVHVLEFRQSKGWEVFPEMIEAADQFTAANSNRGVPEGSPRMAGQTGNSAPQAQATVTNAFGGQWQQNDGNGQF